MARVFSGIKPTGEMQLGNYVGAVRRWVAQQHADAIYCVVDLHAMTVPYDPAELTESTRRLATMLLASGLDPDRSLLFVQSQVPQHAELCWILNNVATVGELRRMTQFKDKVAKHGGSTPESVSAGLFDYPVLMAADILLYDTDEVPIGDDQRQHLELSRDLAIRFNHRFGDTFVVPKGTFPSTGARIMDLQDPTSKMSKSVESPQGTVLVLDDAKAITKKIKSAVTDSGAEVALRPGREARGLEPARDPRRRSPTARSRRSRPSSPAPATARSRPRSPRRSSRRSGRCGSATRRSPPIRPRSSASSRPARRRPRRSRRR